MVSAPASARLLSAEAEAEKELLSGSSQNLGQPQCCQ